MFSSHITHKIIASALVLSFVLPGIALPAGLYGVQKAEAAAVTCVNCKTNVQGQAQLGLEGLKLGLANADNFKEFVLDPLVWALINTIITNMLQELTRWVNSGFEGKPAFITDLRGFLLDAMDEVAGEFLADQGLEFLCSPFRLDVKIALNITYQQARNNTTANECRLTDMVGNIENFLQGTFSEGGWASWFDLTMEPTNDPNRAFLENRARLRIRLIDAYGRELTQVAAKDFFLDVKICEGKGVVIETKTKKAPKDCVVTTPGRIVEAQVNDALGLPRQRLAFADEFDELIGALLAQLVNQILMGINGLLGMGGSDYAVSGYGPDGNQTYLDALGDEASDNVSSGGLEYILDAVEKLETFVERMREIIDMVNVVETELNRAKKTYGSCFAVRMTPDLTDTRDIARTNIIAANNNLGELNILLDNYVNASTSAEQTAVIEEFYAIQNDVVGGVDTAIIQAEIEIDYVLPDKINTLRGQINGNVASCESSSSI